MMDATKKLNNKTFMTQLLLNDKIS